MSYLNDWWRVFFGGMEYPYTDSCKYNDDWLLEVVKKLVEEFANFVNLNTIKYADPLAWDITRQYEKNTVVVDNRTGNAYISRQPVPAGVQIDNSNYWTEIYNYQRTIQTLRNQIATDEGNVTTASKAFSVGDLVFVTENLYRVISPMIAGDSFVVDSNVKKTTVEAEIKRILDEVDAKIGDLDNLTTTDKSNVVAAINEVAASIALAITEVVGDLDNLTTTDKSNVVAAINEVKDDIATAADELKIHLTSIYNVVELGVVLNDNTKGTENAAIINQALSEHKYLFFPAGICYIDSTLNMVDKSGIIGESPYTSVIQTTGDFNGVNVPVSVNDSDGVSCSVIITKILISGTFNATTNNTSYGIFFYNYTFNVTCNRDADRYAQYNNGYGLEFRSSIVKDLRVGAFAVGIYLDNYTAVINISDCMITTCKYAGLISYCSDANFEQFFITFCYHGIFLRAENIHFSNSKVYVNGVIVNSDVVPNETPVGLLISGSWTQGVIVTAVDVQENAHNGIYVGDGAHNIVLNGVIADGNGFTDQTNTNVGIHFYDCFNISGNVLCTDRSATPTQRIGCYINNNCHNFNLDYQEYGNKQTINAAGFYTYNLLNHNVRRVFISPTLPASLTADPLTTQLLALDNDRVDVHIRASVASDVTTGDTLVDLSSLLSSLPNYGSTPSHITLSAINATTGVICMCEVDDNKIKFVQGATAGDLILLDASFRIKYWI